MKKIGFLAIAAIAAMSFTSCGSGSVSAEFNDEVDSIAYDLGVGQAEGLKQYMTMQLGVDSANMDSFIKGLIAGAQGEQNKDQEAYTKGMQAGQTVKQMAKGLTMDVYGNDSVNNIGVNNILAGLIDGLTGKASKTQEEAFADFNTKLQAIIEAKVLDQYSDNKKAGEDFLAENAKKEGVTTTASGLQYKVLVEGKGALPTDSTVVKCKYEGRLIDGKVFDSTEKNGGEPFEVNMKFPRVIEGWVEALKLMPAGSKWEVYIPQELAYGSQDMGEIKPFSTLIFTIETLK